MALLINYMNATAAHHKQRHDMVHDAVRYLGVKSGLQKRIEDYFDYLRQYAHPGALFFFFIRSRSFAMN